MKSPESRSLVIPPERNATRLDRALAEELQGEHSRTEIVRLIKEGRVLLNGRPAKPSTEVIEGDRVAIDFPEPEPCEVLAEDIPLRVVFEDEHFLVIDKPAGMVTHPAGPFQHGTLVNALLFRVKDLSGIGGVLRPGIVHRLDKGTTGLLAVAKHDEAHRRLAEQLQKRTMKRTYDAFVWGKVGPEEFVIDAPIGRHPRDRKRMGIVEGGKEARSRVRVIFARELGSRLEVSLETGRTHQIRVHLTSRGHPLIGDDQYGGRRRAARRVLPAFRARADALLDLVDRPALHARRLDLVHPFDGTPLSFESPTPAELLRLAEALTAGDSPESPKIR